MNEMNSAIEVKNVSKRYATVEAVRDVSLTVAPGEIVGLIGADGAGKTTTMKMICGLLRPDAGSIHVAGFDVDKDNDKVKERLGYMPQRFSLYPDLTVSENIRFFSELFRLNDTERDKRTARLYEFSKLGPFRDRRAGQLSGGMKQKLALCCNLIHEPDVMVLDEPTFGVDPVSRRELWDILKDLKRRGSALLVSTAYMDEAEMCNRVNIMHEGKILVSGKTEELLQSYPYRLFELYREDISMSELEDLSHTIAKIKDVRNVNRFGDRLHVSITGDTALTGIQNIAGSYRVVVKAISPVMEDVFVTAVGK